jgi:hypothetical protein
MHQMHIVILVATAWALSSAVPTDVGEGLGDIRALGDPAFAQFVYPAWNWQKSP